MDSHPSPSDDAHIRRSLNPLPRHFSTPIRRVGTVLRSSLGFGRMLGSGLGARDVASSPGGLDTVRVPEGAWHLPRHEEVQTGPVDTQMAALRAAMMKNRPARVVEPARRGVPIVARRMGRTMKGESVGPSGLTRQIRPAESAIPRNESHGVDRAAQGHVTLEDPMEALRRGMQARREGDTSTPSPASSAAPGAPRQRRASSRQETVNRSADLTASTPRPSRPTGRQSPRARSGPRPPRSASDGESSSGAGATSDTVSSVSSPSASVPSRSPASAVAPTRSLPRRVARAVPLAGRRRGPGRSASMEARVPHSIGGVSAELSGLTTGTTSGLSDGLRAPGVVTSGSTLALGVRPHQLAPAGVARRALAFSMASPSRSLSGPSSSLPVESAQSGPSRSAVYRSESRSAVTRLAHSAPASVPASERESAGAPDGFITPSGRSLHRLIQRRSSGPVATSGPGHEQAAPTVTNSEPLSTRSVAQLSVASTTPTVISRLAAGIGSGFTESRPSSTPSVPPALTTVWRQSPVAAPLVGKAARSRVPASATSQVRRRVAESVSSSQLTRSLARRVMTSSGSSQPGSVRPGFISTNSVSSGVTGSKSAVVVDRSPFAVAEAAGGQPAHAFGAVAAPMPSVVSRRAHASTTGPTLPSDPVMATTVSGTVVPAAVMDRSLSLAERVAALAGGTSVAAGSVTEGLTSRRSVEAGHSSAPVGAESLAGESGDEVRSLAPSAAMSLPIAGRAIVSRRVESVSAGRLEVAGSGEARRGFSSGQLSLRSVSSSSGQDVPGGVVEPVLRSPVNDMPVAPARVVSQRSSSQEAHGSRTVSASRSDPESSAIHGGSTTGRSARVDATRPQVHRRLQPASMAVRDVPARRVTVRPPAHVMRMMANGGSGAVAPALGGVPDFGVRLAAGTPRPIQNLLMTGTVSNGDEAGVTAGVASPMTVGPDHPILDSSKVFASAVARRATRPVRHSDDARTTLMRSAIPEHATRGASSTLPTSGSPQPSSGSSPYRADVPAAVLDRSRPLAERVAALAGRGPAAQQPAVRQPPATAQTSLVARAATATMPVRPAVSAIAGGHARGMDSSTVSRSQTSTGATSTSTRLIRSARSDQVVPAPLPAPRLPMITPSASPTAASSVSQSTGSAGVSRSSPAAIRRTSSPPAKTSSSNLRPGGGRAAVHGETDPGAIHKGRVVRSQTAIQRRALRPSTPHTAMVSRAQTEGSAGSDCSGAGGSASDNSDMTEQVLEALEERILRALERRGGIQRGWF